ncbi:uncharacterized protein BT62DRAFT_1014147 [Guyanagaster necrorhizus]|uniref:Uncharacterized protein n=1 Tax=Guyanagaster necrorhizus TaxID=856835 RepID=A0A9P7VEU4_9AGAR|nr:uncharacterized protein BT62DRAFT_1014147 [Guyanagaster necrorhizus MCA 3950]KAG7439292.1 hypothetical protein BT62DRAFT_1014147 [Guyanagaster necrorhizus MCA 3950]
MSEGEQSPSADIAAIDLALRRVSLRILWVAGRGSLVNRCCNVSASPVRYLVYTCWKMLQASTFFTRSSAHLDASWTQPVCPPTDSRVGKRCQIGIDAALTRFQMCLASSSPVDLSESKRKKPWLTEGHERHSWNYLRLLDFELDSRATLIFGEMGCLIDTRLGVFRGVGAPPFAVLNIPSHPERRCVLISRGFLNTLAAISSSHAIEDLPHASFPISEASRAVIRGRVNMYSVLGQTSLYVGKPAKHAQSVAYTASNLTDYYSL